MIEPDIEPRRHREKLFFLMFAGAIGIMLLIISGYRLVEFSDSTSFCGKLCHQVMYPEYTVYQASPHSRVLCSQCHVGPGASYLVKSKVSGVPLIFATLSGEYERPIPTPVENLRPARETCEACHRPELFSGDLVVSHTTYGTDEKNTPKVDTRVLRVGGGESKVAQGIHWHITADVYYLATDKTRNDINWVGVVGRDGKVAEYIDPKMPVDVGAQLAQDDKRLMDCVDCHNRATHIFQSPQQLIDSALVQGKIDSSLPFIKYQGIRALDPQNPSVAQAIAKVDTIEGFYRDNYPQVYKDKKAAVIEAVASLEEIARLTTFPDMKASWKSYPTFAGHQEAPGCLRCHGKLVATDGPQKGKPIDAACDLCHYFTLPQAR